MSLLDIEALESSSVKFEAQIKSIKQQADEELSKANASKQEIIKYLEDQLQKSRSETLYEKEAAKEA